MKLYRSSICAYLLNVIRFYGNLPYSALKLLSLNYESVKDSIQKLIRAGYVGVIKAKHLKSLYVAASGMEAFKLYCANSGEAFHERSPVIYYAPKLYRLDKLSETRLLFDLAVPHAYSDSRLLKRESEKHTRASDKLKYSRFTGIWLATDAGWVVYHFGGTNIQLNDSGELNARLLAQEKFQGYASMSEVPMLILGDSTDTALSALRYSEWYLAQNKGRRKHLKNIHYHLPIGTRLADCTYFLPLAQASIQMLQMMHRGQWDETIQKIHDAYLGRGMEVCGILDCKLRYLFCAHAYYKLNQAKNLLIVCYDWQEALVTSYLADITDRVEIWVQTVPQEVVWDWYNGGQGNFGYSPYRLLN